MKKFYNSKSRVIFMLVFALLLQIVGPVVVDAVAAVEVPTEAEEPDQKQEEGEASDEKVEKNDQEAEEPDQKQEEGEASDEKVEKNDQEAEEPDQKQEEGKAGESEPGKETETDEVDNENPLSPRPEPLNIPKDLGNIFTEVRMKLNGVEIADESTIEIVDGMELKIEFDWKLGDEVELTSGDWSMINLPVGVELQRDEEGDLPDENNADVGKYYLNKADNTLKVVFNDELVNKTDRLGEVWVAFDFDLSKFENDTTQIIKFGTNPEKEFTIKVKPKDGATIIKTGKADKGLNASEIIWTIDVNTSLDTIKNAVVTDEIPESLKLESIELYNLTVGYNGDTSLGSKVGDRTEFPISLGEINSAYRIIVKTSIEDRKDSFTNKATITGDGVSDFDDDIVETPGGSNIDKFDGVVNKGLNPEYITWRIEVNTAESDINGAKIKDTLVDGLSLREGSLKIYNLTVNSDGTKSRGVEATEAVYSYDSKDIVVDLGDIDSAYEIEYITDIKYGEGKDDYGKTITFNNTAKLIGIEDGSDKELGEDTSKATVKRASIAEKIGIKSITPMNKKINWEIKVNEAKDTIYDIWVEDKSGPGIEFIPGTLKVYKGGTELIEGTDYNLQIPGDDGKDFKVILSGKRATTYTVKYSTEITDLNMTKFVNAASISWIPGSQSGEGSGGPGEGEGEGSGIPSERIYKEIVKPIEVNIQDSYSKSNKGINYKEKTMDWRIDLHFYKGKTTNLVITDTFPNDGLVFLEDTLKIKYAGNELIKGVDYTVKKIDGTTGYGEGFKIELNEGYENNNMYIYYSTSFDPDHEGYIANESQTYKNKAKITGKTTYDGKTTEISTIVNAHKKILDAAFNNGGKVGKLNRAERTISWDVYINYMSKDLKEKDFILEDTLSEGQSFDKSTFKVHPYEVKEDGGLGTMGEAIDPSKYKLEENPEGRGFKLTFENGIDQPYVLKFKTNIEGISKPSYENTAQVIGANKYSAKVTYPNHDKFLLKETTNVDENRVWIDDRIDWKLTINESLSDIENATIVDEITKGLIYVNDSVKITNKAGDVLANDKYEVVTEEDGENTKLTIIFLENIDETYIVEYSTVVVTQTGKVKNKASFSGNKIEIDSESGVEINVKQSSGGTGSGRDKKGSIIINKVDESEDSIPITAEAEFEIYYMLNGEKRLLEDKTFKTVDGKIELYDLSFRTYYIREITAPNGFKFDNEAEDVEVVVDKAAGSDNLGAFVKNIKNENIKIEVTGKKVWEGGPGADIELQLYRNDKALEGEEYKVKLESGTTSYTWKNLNKTDNAGIDYIYTVKEVGVPDGYTKTEEGLTVTNTVKKGDIEFKKVNTSGNPLKGAEFKIYKASDVKFENPLKNPTTEEDIIAISDDDGIVRFEDLDYNNYIIRETKAPSGYYRTSQLIEVSFEDFLDAEGNGDEVVEVVVVEKEDLKNNRIVYGRDSLELVKLGEDGESDYLSGAIFELLQNGEVKYTSDVTGSDGRVTFTNLAYGTYTVREKQAPEGYVLDPQAQEISITTGGELKTLTFVNKKAKGNIKLIKTDDSESPKRLAGAEFTLYDSEGKALEIAISNKDGEVLFKDIELGEYRIRETKAPKGYELNEKEFKIAIVEDGVTVDEDMDGLELRLENKLDPENPKDPEDPDKPDPEDPEEGGEIDPEDPGEGGRPGDPEDPEDGEIDPTKPGEGGRPGDPSKPTDPVKPAKPGRPGQSGLPKTGQVSNGLFYLLGAVFIGLGFRMRKKK